MFGFIFSLLIGALAGYIAGRIMGSETSTVRNIVLGILGGFVGSIVFGLIGLSATGIVVRSSFPLWVPASASGSAVSCSTDFSCVQGCSSSFSRRAVIFLRHRLFASVLPQNQILTAHRKYDRIFLVAEHARKFYLLLWLSW